MHWAMQIAQELVKKYPDRETFVCASGISPSGSVHIGNFRELVTTFFVVKSLQKLGRNTRFIFSWDDFDRLRKVPKNVDPSFEQYIGMPYSSIPDPCGCHKSYAAHFEAEFEESIRPFGMPVEFIYQSREYQSGRYNPYIVHALRNRKEIYDIMMEFKTSDGSEEEREGFYPITVYCQSCGKDFTKVEDFEEQKETVTYSCECGHHDVLDVLNATNIKLNWKIDWPMRWMVEQVIFEPGGRDHSSETGSYNVSKQISERIFCNQPPEYAAYDFISVKGSHEKMSSSSGNSITPKELLNIYLPDLLLFLFAKYRPEAAFHIGLDDDVVRNYTEYERFVENQSSINEDLQYSLKLAGQTRAEYRFPRFSQVANILPLVDFDVSILKDILVQSGELMTLDEVQAIAERVEYWTKTYQQDRMVKVNRMPNHEYYATLTSTQKQWLSKLCNIVHEWNQDSSETFMQNVYAICHDEDKKVKRNNQKSLFQIVYRLVLNSTSGPRIPILVEVVGKERILELLDF